MTNWTIKNNWHFPHKRVSRSTEVFVSNYISTILLLIKSRGNFENPKSCLQIELKEKFLHQIRIPIFLPRCIRWKQKFNEKSFPSNCRIFRYFCFRGSLLVDGRKKFEFAVNLHHRALSCHKSIANLLLIYDNFPEKKKPEKFLFCIWFEYEAIITDKCHFAKIIYHENATKLKLIYNTRRIHFDFQLITQAIEVFCALCKQSRKLCRLYRDDIFFSSRSHHFNCIMLHIKISSNDGGKCHPIWRAAQIKVNW